MSRREDIVALRHMLDHAREAVDVMNGRTLDDLRTNRVLNLAIVRLLEIVGEAANRVSEQTQGEYPDMPWREIIAMRNRMIHGYDSVDMRIVWNVVMIDLPRLIAQLELDAD
jgi:uncharacterized protein with HEPN domain